MKYLFCLLLLSAPVIHAQDLTATVVNTSGESPLASPYLFDAAPAGASSSITVRLRNSSGNPIMVAAAVANAAQGTSVASTDFTVTNSGVGLVLASGVSTSFDEFTLTFAPQSTGLLTAYLQVTYQIQKDGCNFTSQSPAEQCAGQTALLSILQGTGTAPVTVLSYQSGSGSVTLQPGSSTPLDFGNISTSASKAITFTITNQSAATVTTPAVKLLTAAYNTTAFALDTSALSATLPASGTTSFTVTFAPGQAVQSNATLQVGVNTYAVVGTGIVAGGLDALVISYVDSTGVSLIAQSGSPIDFGQLVVGASSGSTLTFLVANPSSSFDALVVPSIVLSGTGFSLKSAPATPVSIPPGQSTSFQVVFAPSAAGSFTGALAIGTRQFTMTGTASKPALDLSLAVDIQPLTSQQQAHVSVQSSTAAQAAAIGQLSMTFTPSVSGVTDDPSVVFTATGGRQLQLTIPQGGQNALYSGQSALTFQTGATAGTITFTLTFPNQPAVTKSFTISPASIQISSGSAVRQSSSLIITLSGLDNTYTAGALSFTFFNTSGQQINASAITVDESSTFHNFFLNQSTAGGAFSVQATFPVVGDTSQVGSARVVLSNSSGASTVTETFQ